MGLTAKLKVVPVVPSRDGRHPNRNQTSGVTEGDEAGLCESLSIVACFEMYNCNNFFDEHDRANRPVMVDLLHKE